MTTKNNPNPEGHLEELKQICRDHHERELNPRQCDLLWLLYSIQPGDWALKFAHMQEIIEDALQALDADARSPSPRVKGWGDGGLQS